MPPFAAALICVCRNPHKNLKHGGSNYQRQTEGTKETLLLRRGLSGGTHQQVREGILHKLKVIITLEMQQLS